jgi:outer membrane immunogenic protein
MELLMKKLCAILAAGSAVMAAVPAFAQDVPSHTFSGPRVEAIAGYDSSRSGSTVDNDTTRNTKQSINGLVYGAAIGYDAPVGNNLVIGADAEISSSTAKWDNNNGVANTFNLGRVKAGRDIYVGGRIGYAVSPQTLVYLKGGYTNARFNLEGTDGTTNLSQRLDTDGYRVGAGVEYAISPKSFVKLEYRYSNYKKAEYDYNGTTPDSSRFNIDTDRHQVVAGVGVRF